MTGKNDMKYVNLTPHAISLNNGTSIPAEEKPARVSSTHSGFNADLICKQQFGEVENLPEPKEGVVYIVSALVLSALNNSRSDVVAPATGHPETVRNEKGQILSVPGFVQ